MGPKALDSLIEIRPPPRSRNLASCVCVPWSCANAGGRPAPRFRFPPRLLEAGCSTRWLGVRLFDRVATRGLLLLRAATGIG